MDAALAPVAGAAIKLAAMRPGYSRQEQSTVVGGTVKRLKVDGDGGALQLTAAQSQQSLAIVFRDYGPLGVVGNRGFKIPGDLADSQHTCCQTPRRMTVASSADDPLSSSDSKDATAADDRRIRTH